MKLRNYFKIFALAAVLTGGFLAVQSVHAASTTTDTNITFPISELGGCASTSDCKKYCDSLEHVEACVNFGKEHGLISADDAAAGLKLKALKTGPGGCTDKQSCSEFCADAANVDACAKFAEDHKILDSDQLAKFRKFHEAVRKGDSPGDCKTKEACETYCSAGAHADVCLKFATDNGLITSDQAAKIRKFQVSVAAGETPGGCKTKDACEEYCNSDDHKTDCLKFATDLGLIKQAEAEKLRTGDFEGPGSCKSREACASFCNDTANQQTCLDFAKQHNVLDKTQTDSIETANRTVKEIKSLPAPVIGCLKEKLTPEVVSAIQDGNFTPDETSSKQIRLCILNFAERNKNTSNTPPTANPPPSETPVKKDLGNSDPSTKTPELKKTTIPLNVRECIIRTYGQDYVKRVESGAVTDTNELKTRFAKCLEIPKEIKPSATTNQNQDRPTTLPPKVPSTVKEPFKSDQ